MSLFGRPREASRANPPTSHNPPGSAPVVLPPAADGSNPIRRMLDAFGLPWREPRRDVEERVGIELDQLYRGDAVFFADSVRPPGFLQPWRTDVFERYAPDMPVVRFSGLAWFEDGAAANIELSAGFFAERLGAARIGQEYNTLACGWRSATASLQLLAWPPAWQSRGGRNDAHEREPRLVTACHVSLRTGFRLPLSAAEERWVADFRTSFVLEPPFSPEPGGVRDTAPSDTEVEYARDPAGYLADVQGRIGCPPGREALILCTNQLFVLPASDVMGFEVMRLLPAKGRGGSSLAVRCRTTCPGVAYKTLHVTHHGDPDGVTATGRELAAMFGTSCEVSPYVQDV